MCFSNAATSKELNIYIYVEVNIPGDNMIEKISVKNFKSIRKLEMNCRRVNLFIGEPNTGKSNILEVLGFFSWVGNRNGPIRSYIRMNNAQNLFYDGQIEQEIMLSADKDTFQIAFNGNQFEINTPQNNNSNITVANMDYSGNVTMKRNYDNLKKIRFYRFNATDMQNINSDVPGALIPPHGENLFNSIFGKKELRELLGSFFKPYGFKLLMMPQEKNIMIQKIDDDIAIGHPFNLVSDTLREMVFDTTAIESNSNATLVFEEPGAKAFPYYTKILGERIGRNARNQYFIATHNPYLLASIVEKTDINDINICLTYYENFETKIKQLSSQEISELLDMDPFFGIDHFLGEEE